MNGPLVFENRIAFIIFWDFFLRRSAPERWRADWKPDRQSYKCLGELFWNRLKHSAFGSAWLFSKTFFPEKSLVETSYKKANLSGHTIDQMVIQRGRVPALENRSTLEICGLWRSKPVHLHPELITECPIRLFFATINHDHRRKCCWTWKVDIRTENWR